MTLRPSYLIRLLDAVSQWLNVALLNGDANESISGRAFRQRWRRTVAVIDTLVWWEPDHCMRAYQTDILRARKLIEENA